MLPHLYVRQKLPLIGELQTAPAGGNARALHAEWGHVRRAALSYISSERQIFPGGWGRVGLLGGVISTVIREAVLEEHKVGLGTVQQGTEHCPLFPYSRDMTLAGWFSPNLP